MFYSSQSWPGRVRGRFITPGKSIMPSTRADHQEMAVALFDKDIFKAPPQWKLAKTPGRGSKV